MMENNQQQQDIEELVERKVRHSVAKKVIKEIHQQVDEIELIEEIEQNSRKWVIPLLIGLLVIVLLLLLI